MIGKFSKVIRNNPPPKFKKLLQKMPITTLIAVSMAIKVRVRTFFKVLVAVFFIKNTSSPRLHRAKERRLCLFITFCRMKRDAESEPQAATAFRPDGNSPSLRHFTLVFLLFYTKFRSVSLRYLLYPYFGDLSRDMRGFF